jgi:transposase
MPVYIGVDFHARQQTISCLITETGELEELELAHADLAEVRRFYQRFQGQRVLVGFESSGYAAWFEELLEELGHEIWIGDAYKIRKCAVRRQKNDRRDAELIRDLLVQGEFPRLHRQTPTAREMLQQLRYRQRLVKLRTMLVNTLLFMASSRGVSLRGQLRSKSGLARLQAVVLPPHLAQQRSELVEVMEQLTSKLATLDKWLAARAEADPRVVLVRTHPGIGPLTGLCLVYTLEPVSRFPNSRKVAGYIGFDPMEDSSADRHRLGAISKQGSRLLRFYLGEAGQSARREDEDLERTYVRLTMRRNHGKAKVALARRLLVRAYIMLRDEIDYAEFQRRGVAARSARGSA